MNFNNVEVRLTEQAKIYLEYLRAKGLTLSDEEILKILVSKPIEFGDQALHVAILKIAISNKEEAKQNGV